MAESHGSWWYPKDPFENKAFRLKVARRCEADPSYAKTIRHVCKENVLFWINVFGWTFDPRLVGSAEYRDVPFITYEMQDDAILTIEKGFGKEDFAVVKSRATGGTWIVIAIYTHKWLFFRSMSMGLVSREAGLVDGTNKSLFAKVDYLIEKQPRYLMPGPRQTEPKGHVGYFRKEFYLENLTNSSVMEGSTTTKDMFRGDRHTSIFEDEKAAGEEKVMEDADAATALATENRIMVSTPQGAHGPFYRAAKNPTIKRIELPWWRHPVMNRGLVTRPKTAFTGPNGEWSPWFQKECDRLQIPWKIAQELNLDFIGSGQKVFDADMIQKLINGDTRPPMFRGYLVEEMSPSRGAAQSQVRFVPSPGGLLFLWTPLKDGRALEKEHYAGGVDTSLGMGATNSVITIVDRRTGEMAAEFATPNLEPTPFARELYLLAKFFNNAYLLIEVNGPGSQVRKRLVEMGYLNAYFRRNEQSLSKKETDTMGWASTRQNKLDLIGDYASSLSRGTFINRSRPSLEECLQYEWDGNQIVNANHKGAMDHSGATVSHGDRVMAAALANKAIVDQGDEPLAAETEEDYTPNEQHYSPMTFIGRRIEAQMRERKLAEW